VGEAVQAISENVTIATINAAATLGGILITGALTTFVAVLNARIKRIGRDAAESREQLANDHITPDGKPINLRVEADERHEENRGALREIRSALRALAGMMNNGFEGLQNQINDSRSRIESIETTAPRPGPGKHRAA
jgi:hypothetical protein